MQVASQQKPSLKIYRAGNDIFEIETICELKKLDFFDAVYSIQKIRDRKYQGNWKDILGSVLVKISVFAGIKNEIDSFTKQDISKMITTTYSDLALEEIYKAFELERYGVYEAKTEHFQMFDSNYISEILKKYKKWKLTEKNKLNFEVPTALITEISELEKVNLLKTATQSRYEEFLKNNFLAGKHDYIFDFLVEQNKIIVSNNPKNKEWFEVRLSIAKKILLETLSTKKAKSKYDLQQIKRTISGIENNNSDRVLIKAKEIIIQEYFQKQADFWITNIFE